MNVKELHFNVDIINKRNNLRSWFSVLCICYCCKQTADLSCFKGLFKQ